MKKIILLAFAWLLFSAVPALGAKTNNAGADKTYVWHLSGAVMPIPPYGLADIVGSDTASKLIVNQPNGNVSANLTGVMKGLMPNTTYTVYLSNPYVKYIPGAIVGTWTVMGSYTHDITATIGPDGSFTGIGGYPSGAYPYTSPGQTPEAIAGGQITGNTITFTTTYAGPYDPGYTATVIGTIGVDGSITGNVPWLWSAPAGTVTLNSGNTGWPGQLTGTEPFTFTTSSDGTGSWHYNFKGEAPGALSVWINSDAGTILISDPITLP